MIGRLVEVDFGSLKLEVPEGGYYDRFRMNPVLDDVARDPGVGDIAFFRRIPKTVVVSRVGPVWAPNFYYRSSSVQLLLVAPAKRLRAVLPEPLEPLLPLPGRGLVALTLFSYKICDSDPYNEASIAVVIRRPRTRGLDSLELMKSVLRRSFFAHVLALPVDTEVARVRGVHGYQLPKWIADIELEMEGGIAGRVAARSGPVDLQLAAPLPQFQCVASQSRIAMTNTIHLVDGQWSQTTVVSNILAFAQQRRPKHVQLTRHGGPMSQLLDGLGATRIVAMDVVKDAQLALFMPRALGAGPF